MSKAQLKKFAPDIPVTVEVPHVTNSVPNGGMTAKQASDYRYWRLRIMYATIFGYATFYLIRMNFNFAVPLLKTEFGFTNTDVGLITSTFSIVYGVGKLLNGYLGDNKNARYFMTTGLVGSALVNICFGFCESLYFFIAFWAINAWFQSMAWPPVAKLLTHWYSKKELGTKWGIWNSSHSIGGAAISVLAGYLIMIYGWQGLFFIPAAISLCVSLLLFNRLRDTPKSLGLPPVEVYKGTVHIDDAEDDEDPLSTEELLKRVFTNKLLWYVCIANMFLYIVRLGVFNWAPTFLQELKGSSPLASAWQTAAFELAGIAGGICAGYLSDRIFKGNRGPVATIYMFVLTFVLLYFCKVPPGHLVFDSFALIGVGFLVYGPQVLVGVAAADFCSKKAAAMATGLTGTFGYIGVAISGVGVGIVADTWGWEGAFMFFIASAFLGMLFFMLTWHKQGKHQQ